MVNVAFDESTFLSTLYLPFINEPNTCSPCSQWFYLTHVRHVRNARNAQCFQDTPLLKAQTHEWPKRQISNSNNMHKTRKALMATEASEHKVLVNA